MNPFVISTAVPFGYLFIWGAVFAAMVGGLILLFKSLRRRPVGKGGAAAGAFLLLGGIGLITVNLDAETALDMNPFLDGQMIAGEWREGSDVLRLAPDGSFSCAGEDACAELGEKGTWARQDDFELSFDSEAGTSLRRVVRYREKLKLTNAFDDPDMWDGRLTFEHL